MTTQLLTAADHTSPSNRNPTSQQLLKDQIKVLTNFFKNRLLKGGVMKRLMLNVLFFFQPTEEHVEKLNQAIQDNMNDPNNPTTQLNLINTSKDFIPVNIQHWLHEGKKQREICIQLYQNAIFIENITWPCGDMNFIFDWRAMRTSEIVKMRR